MTTENRRKEEHSKAKTEEPRESLAPLLNGATVDKTGKEISNLPSGHDAYYDLGHSNHEPPYTVPYVRWCERTGAGRLPPTRFTGKERLLRVALVR